MTKNVSILSICAIIRKVRKKTKGQEEELCMKRNTLIIPVQSVSFISPHLKLSLL